MESNKQNQDKSKVEEKKEFYREGDIEKIQYDHEGNIKSMQYYS